MSDYMDFDEMISEEDNPFDNPDNTFSCEGTAYRAGYKLAMTNDGNAIDLGTEIDYPSMADEDAIDAFREGYKDGGLAWIDARYGDEQ